jgi:plasmid stabilization system protein ParE
MNIAWSREAIDDLARLRSYISENDPSAAQRVARYILHQVEAVLPDNPEWPHWPRCRDAGAGHPKDAFHHAVSGERAVARNLAHLSRRTTLARSFLKRLNNEPGYGDDHYRRSNKVPHKNTKRGTSKCRLIEPFHSRRTIVDLRPMRQFTLSDGALSIIDQMNSRLKCNKTGLDLKPFCDHDLTATTRLCKPPHATHCPWLEPHKVA